MPVRARSRLTRLVAVEVGDERPVRDHRRKPGHVVARRDVGHEVLHERPDTAHDTADDGSDGRPAGQERQPGGADRDEVGVEVDEVVPACGVRQVRAAVGGRDEDDVVDGGRPVGLRQKGFDEGSSHQTAAAVGDDVDRHVGARVLASQLGEEVDSILSRVDAQGPVVVADDGVVGGEHRLQEALGARHQAHRGKRPDRRRERAVDEQQHPHRAVRGQAQGGTGAERLPGPGCGAGGVDEARADGLLELADDTTHDERRHEAKHDRLHRTVHEVTEQPTVVGLLGGQGTSVASCPHVRRRRPPRLDVDLEGQRSGLEGPRATGRAQRQVPRVDTVPLEQDDGVVGRRHVDVEAHGAATVRRTG